MRTSQIILAILVVLSIVFLVMDWQGHIMIPFIALAFNVIVMLGSSLRILFNRRSWSYLTDTNEALDTSFVNQEEEHRQSPFHILPALFILFSGLDALIKFQHWRGGDYFFFISLGLLTLTTVVMLTSSSERRRRILRTASTYWCSTLLALLQSIFLISSIAF